MSAERRVLELAGAWWQKAQEDLQAARRLSDMPFPCCFHCQQAAEKALKALLVVGQVEFGKTHDLGQLLALLPPEARLPLVEDGRALEGLTRYPPGDAGPEEAAAALALAVEFLAALRAALPDEVSG